MRDGTSHLVYIGLDGCRAGWFFIGVDGAGEFHFGVFNHFDEIDPFLYKARLILVDIPIGLPWQGQKIRLCDTAARQAISPRGSSVFPAPCRTAMYQASYAEGSAENRRILGKGLSKQTWLITPKIREVDEFIRNEKPGEKVREMHPEVAFWALNGKKVLEHKKKERAGIRERLQILSRHFPHSQACFDKARQQFLVKDVASDDIIDAMVGAVTAMQNPRLTTFPENPALDEEGISMEIVYCPDF